ncbi:MAG TPA: DNA repair protein RadC [Patescibacteria group bacterium]
MKNIHSLPRYQRPREKLAELGPTNLTDVELMALLLGSGTQRYPVLQLADQILKTFDHHRLQSVQMEHLTQIPGLGQVQAGKVLAALELGKRLVTDRRHPQILQAQDVLREVHHIRHTQREHLVALYLNARNEVVHKEILTIGGLNFNNLEIRDVFVPAFKHPCMGVILAHNHPSGDPTPSDDDKKMTSDIQKAGELLGIRVIDHLIVTGVSWSSVLAPTPDGKAHGQQQ